MPRPERHVLVCLNQRPPGSAKGSCAEKGAEAVLQALKTGVAEAGLRERVIVSGTRCLKHCSRGVTVAVHPDNAWYGGVTPADAAEICAEHLGQGRILDRLAMPDIPWE